MLDLSIIIVNWNTRQITADCLRSIQETAGALQYEVIVVDNASSDGSPAMIREQFGWVKLIENQDNPGFAGANNQGMAVSQGRYLLLLNSDTIVKPGALQAAMQFMDGHPEVGLCGIRLLNPDGSFQTSHAPFPNLLSEFLIATTLGRRLLNPYYPTPRPGANDSAQEVDWVVGAFMLLRREVYEKVGGMDTTYWMYSEETDWCYRIKQAGFRIFYLPEIAIIHIGGASTRQRKPEMMARLTKSKVLFFAKNYGLQKAQRLYAIIWTIYFFRELNGRLMCTISRNKDRWQREIRVSQLIREECRQVAWGEN